MPFKLMADLPAGCPESAATNVAAQVGRAFQCSLGAVDLVMGFCVLEAPTLEIATARAEVVASCGADYRIVDDSGGVVATGRAAGADGATTLGVGNVGGADIDLQLAAPGEDLTPPPFVPDGHSSAPSLSPHDTSDLDFLEPLDQSRGASAPVAGGGGDGDGLDRLELVTLDGEDQPPMLGGSGMDIARAPTESAHPAVGAGQSVAPGVHGDDAFAPPAEGDALELADIAPLETDAAPPLAPLGVDTAPTSGDDAFSPFEGDEALELDTEAAAAVDARASNARIGAASSPSAAFASSPAVGGASSPDVGRASSPDVGRASSPGLAAAAASSPDLSEADDGAAASRSQPAKRARARASARPAGFLLFGGKLRDRPRTRVLIGFAIALALGSILPLVHAHSVMGTKVEPHLRQLSRSKAYGHLLKGRSGYRSPAELEETIGSLKRRHGVYTFLIWLGVSGLLGGAWFRFT